MDTSEKIKKLETLPWQALHDIALKKGIEEKEINNKEKGNIIRSLLSYSVLSDEDIEHLVNDYIYGDRIAFTLWTFQSSLQEKDYDILRNLVSLKEIHLSANGFRKLKILSVNEYGDRLEILYVYSKEYTYINEIGRSDSIWEQHRGCLWIGIGETYLACISKHDKMTSCIIKVIAEILSTNITQIKPPKSAIEKCVNFKAISRIALQGKEGEKTVVSRSGGLTLNQEEEVSRIKAERIDISGSYIAEITEDTSATVKYNVKNGNLGIYKHLSAPILFAWSDNAIKIILEEIENLKGKPAEEIFKEVGQEIKWNLATVESNQMNWYLTSVISSLDKENIEVQIPTDKLGILNNDKLFMKLPRVYCKECDSYEIPHCSNCGEPLVFDKTGIKECKCGKPQRIECSEGHNNCEVINWYLPKPQTIKMINYNIQKVYKDYELNFNICIVGDMLYIERSNTNTGVDIPFTSIECFKSDSQGFSNRIREYAVNMNEKCIGTCSHKKVDQCIKSKEKVCLPKIFYTILPSYRPQPHKGAEYGDVAGEVKVGRKNYELKGIIKKNSRNLTNKEVQNSEKIETPLLSTSSEGQEIIRQFVEQGMSDARCNLIAVVVPQYIDASLKGTLRYLARLSGKKITFIELDEVCSLISNNKLIQVS